MKLASLNKICIILLVLNSRIVFSQDVKAKIDVEKVENVLFIAGTAENLKSVYKNISFNLVVLKKNKSDTNKSNSTQDGRVTLEPLQKVSLSKTQINVSKDDQITIVLFIYDENNTVIGKDKVIIGDNNVKAEPNGASLKPKDGLEMIGIVSNETKTKLGNDFYDLFYKEYDKLKINSPKIISIQEELTFGRTTKIIVNIDGEIIDEFIARPDEDFLEYMAKTSSSKVFTYFKKIEKQEKSILHY
ncbi:CsgE family curli-type amyloid fiber assembly protein [uncultured Flavobacterium sp.]|uniref:CsgE family curli-type amyloid fiber assembly protein n=1 Tax=uncultured Flavobacterium sp. TaxID=165435 RepID=UPI00292D001A|nr:CsgE family curli-type amyloid fiber assembly protein [uncultured Flavobacterium sp.]